MAQQIRTEFEAPVTAFLSRQLQHKKTYQAAIEKEFKTKQTQESYVNKAREKYEQDCLRINSFTAQASLVQGKDLEKINLKLERTHQTVQTNERDFANLSKVLQETVQKWEQDWKRFCDSCQDLEDQRMEFMKDNLWSYANAVSTVCVTDDEVRILDIYFFRVLILPQSCEKIRVSLEQMEPEREMENFVRDYGTGGQIPDPPAFVNYQASDAVPSSSARPTYRISNFVRSTNRESPMQLSSQDEEPINNAAGIGAGGGSRRRDSHMPEGADVSRRNTQASSQVNHTAYTNGISGHLNNQSQPSVVSASPATSPTSASSPAHATRRQSVAPAQTPQQQLQRVLQDPYADPVDPTTEMYIRVGENAYKVDPSKDPQQSAPSSSRSATAPAPKPTAGSDVDPLMKQLQDLKNTVSTTGSVRRNTIMKTKIGSTPDPKPTHSAASSISNVNRQPNPVTALSPPVSAVSPRSSNRSPSPYRDYRNSAEAIVGTHPSVSRSPSPNPPIAAFMIPKPGQPTVAESVKEVVNDYQQSLPGEHKSLSRNNSRNRQGSIGAPTGPPPPPQHHLGQPPSQIGHAGVGAHGSRSNSPQPTHSRAPSPQPGQIIHRNSFIQPPMQSGPGIVRAPSPNAIGIALDPSGRVLHDEMAQRYQHQHQQQSPSTPAQPHPGMHQARMAPPQAQQPIYNHPPPQPLNTQMQRKPTYLVSPGGVQSYTPVTPPPPSTGPMGMYHNTPSPQPNYGPQPVAPPPPPVQPLYNPSPVQYQHQPQQQQQQPRPIQQPQQPPGQPHVPPPVPMNHYGNANNDLQRASSLAYYWGQQGAQPVNIPPQQVPTPANQMLAMQALSQQQQPQQPQVYHQPPSQLPKSQVQRSPSPLPPQQSTEDGTPVLFYGEFSRGIIHFGITHFVSSSCSVRLRCHDRRRIRFPSWRHYCCHVHTRRWMVDRRGFG